MNISSGIAIPIQSSNLYNSNVSTVEIEKEDCTFIFGVVSFERPTTDHAEYPRNKEECEFFYPVRTYHDVDVVVFLPRVSSYHNNSSTTIYQIGYPLLLKTCWMVNDHFPVNRVGCDLRSLASWDE